MTEKKILIIDGNSLIFRAYFASAYKGEILKTKNGIPTNAVYSFANMLTSLLTRNDYYDVKVAFDKGKKTFRHEKLEDYKSGRNATPPELIEQFPIVREMLNAAGIDWFELDLFEADDIIGAIAKHVENNFEDSLVEILSSDKDMFQLISDKTKILIPISGTSDLKTFGLDELLEKWQVSPNQVVELKGLMGDASDNLKGVAGIGEKTAIKLICQYHSIEGIYENIDQIKGVLKDKLIKDKDSAFLCREIATIKTDFLVENLKFEQLNLTVEPLVEFLTKYEMYSLTKRMQSRIEKININPPKDEFIVLKQWDRKYEAQDNAVYIEALEDNYHQAKIVGIGIVNEKGNFFINVKNEAKQLSFFDDEIPNKFDNNLNDFFKDETLKKSTYDIKRTVTLLKNANYDVNYNGFDYDMMIAAYILDPNVKSTFFDHLNLVAPEIDLAENEDIFGKGLKRNADIDLTTKGQYILQKASLIFKTKNHILTTLAENDQLDLYQKIDLPFAKVLFSMEQNGVSIDQTELKKQTINVINQLNELDDKMRILLGDLIDETFNFASPKQIQKLLFEDLTLPDYGKGSTGKEYLDKLISLHPIINLLLEYRKLSKLYSTYLKGFEKYIFADQKVHTIFNQTLTNTGRLSSIEPNLQNISTHDLTQKEVRKIFITDHDKKFFSFDYSQIELRVLAQMAPEKELINIFANNGDIHEAAARKIFALSDETSVSSDMRRTAKVFNFGIIYGLSDFGLANDLQISISEAKEYIKSYYQYFPDIQNFKIKTIEFAKTNGYVLTMANRKRKIDELQAKNHQLKQFGERIAVNMPIQGTAADILKVAMIEIYQEILANNFASKMIAQIHDEIIFEIPTNEEKVVVPMIEEKMSSAFIRMLKLVHKDIVVNVKLKVSQASGQDWFELK